ncbi:hypothetical protein G7054_g2732 [Neopestalotiopsis clavispora]|nr:hypothetical protein G7054_g2732 [Neopestalotiopsis clavispora]
MAIETPLSEKPTIDGVPLGWLRLSKRTAAQRRCELGAGLLLSTPAALWRDRSGLGPPRGHLQRLGRVTDYPGVGVEAGSGAPATSNEELFTELALKAHTDEWYIGSPDGKVPGLVNHPKLLQFVADFTGWGDKTLAIRRTLLRNNTPGNKAIGVHYDQIFLRHGEPSVLTAWVPVGDIALDGGGLIYLQDGGFCPC